MMFNEPKTLIVVYKDELFVNQIKKLVETKDDIDEEHIVGTKDDSVRIVSWTEKVWKDQKKAGNINNKVLFIGDVKGVDSLLPVIDIKYDEYGIKYGWAGNQAVLFCDNKKLKKAQDYNDFLVKLNEYSIPDILKTEPRKIMEDVKEESNNFFAKVGTKIKKQALSAKTNVEDWFVANSDKVKKQQYFYGIMKLYENHLEEFMNK